MTRYILKRFAVMAALLLGVSVLVFWLFTLMPGDYYSSNRSLTPEKKAELRALAGLDKPVIVRYFLWLGNMLHGNFGFSLVYKRPVADVLGPLMWNSFIIAFTAFVLTWIIAIIAGVLAATRQYSWFDKMVTILLFASLSIPSFFIGLMMIKIFAIDLHWLPAGGMTDTGSNSTGMAHVFEVMRHMVLPVAILTFLGAGSLTRYFRTGMLEVLRADYIRTARAKGLKERSVVFSHGLRNALLPAITLLAFELPGLFAGAIITETIFGWPGVGKLQLDSVFSRDYDVLMTITMLLALLTVLGSFLADIMYAVADPRVRLIDSGRAS
ncbi:ABC transporter permease [Microbacterium sp. NPDC057650]|uniref:ABC transporter permease n=1 Tax=unclassified Microbacterium TaxID=2609290 RepID=UPI003672F9F5